MDYPAPPFKFYKTQIEHKNEEEPPPRSNFIYRE